MQDVHWTNSVATLHGRRIHYFDTNVLDTTSQPPFLLIHGIGSSAASWQAVSEILHDHGFRVLAVDLPGHGLSHRDRDDYSLSSLATMLRDLLDALDISQCWLVGHSLGGGIALQFSYMFPSYLAGLGLVAAGGLGDETSMVLRAMALPGSGLIMASAFNSVTVSCLRGLASQWPKTRSLPALLQPKSLERFAEIADPGHRRAFLAILRSVVDRRGQMVSALPLLSAIGDRPVVVVWGEADHILPVGHAQNLAEVLPHCQVTLLPGVSHEPHIEAAATTAEQLLQLPTHVS